MALRTAGGPKVARGPDRSQRSVRSNFCAAGGFGFNRNCWQVVERLVQDSLQN
jgi:hypothetical protein